MIVLPFSFSIIISASSLKVTWFQTNKTGGRGPHSCTGVEGMLLESDMLMRCRRIGIRIIEGEEEIRRELSVLLMRTALRGVSKSEFADCDSARLRCLYTFLSRF